MVNNANYFSGATHTDANGNVRPLNVGGSSMATGHNATPNYSAFSPTGQFGNPDRMAFQDNTASQAGLPVGTNPPTGFASQYDPAQLANIIWSTPWAILPDVFKGMNATGPGYQALRDIGADPLTLYNIMVGGNTDFLSGKGNAPGNYTNWLNNLYSSLGSVGGRGFNAGELLGRLFNPVNTKDTQSSLYNILTAGDASTQMRTLFNMVRDASNVGMNPLAARGYQAALSNAGDSALNAMLRQPVNQGANAIPLYEYIRQNNPGLIPG